MKDYEKERQRLEKIREKLELKKQIRELKQANFRLKHPYLNKAPEVAESVGHKFVKSVGTIITDGSREANKSLKPYSETGDRQRQYSNCIICGKQLRTGRKYCYLHRNAHYKMCPKCNGAMNFDYYDNLFHQNVYKCTKCGHWDRFD